MNKTRIKENKMLSGKAVNAGYRLCNARGNMIACQESRIPFQAKELFQNQFQFLS